MGKREERGGFKMSLSDEIYFMGGREAIHVKDVKEFIKQLKDEIKNAYGDSFIPIIDKLAGKELI